MANNNTRLHLKTTLFLVLTLSYNAGQAIDASRIEGCPSSVPSNAAKSPDHTDKLIALSASVWEDSEIPVCWENPLDSDQQERRWVQDAITKTWQTHSGLSFTGWQACSASSKGIRIGVDDINPHTKGLGNQIDGMRDGMVLDFTFEDWSPSCKKKREYCIRTIAVHEFGHALGFAHEQNRSDTPTWCTNEAQGSDGDMIVTPWDLDSVMNYCNPKWAGRGQLSKLDISGLQQIYGRSGQGQPSVITGGNGVYDGTYTAQLSYEDPGCTPDTANLTIQGEQVSAQLLTPDGRNVESLGSFNPENCALNGVAFKLSAVDTITLSGNLFGGLTSSSDCGRGHYRFNKSH